MRMGKRNTEEAEAPVLDMPETCHDLDAVDEDGKLKIVADALGDDSPRCWTTQAYA